MRALRSLGLLVQHELFGHSRVEIAASGDDFGDGFDELRRRAVLGKVTRSAGVHRAARELIGRMHAQDEHRQRRPLTPQILQQLDPADARQREVEHQHVPIGAADLSESLLGVRRLSDNGGRKRARQHLLDALTDDGMIVDEKNARHV